MDLIDENRDDRISKLEMEEMMEKICQKLYGYF